MAKIKISALPSAGSVNDADVLPLVQSGVTKKATVSVLKSVFGSVITASNGLTKAVNDIKLGGALTSDTVLQGAFAFSVGKADGTASVSIFETFATAGQTLLTKSGANYSNININPTNGAFSAGNASNSASLSVQSAGSLSLSILQGVTTRTYTLNTNGLQELSDYSASYVNLSLVSRQYVQGYVASVLPSVVTASNGLTRTVNNIALGGALTGNTSITGATYNFDIGTSGSRIGALTNYSATYTLDTTGLVSMLALGGFNMVEQGTTNFILENQDGSAVMQTRLNVSLSQWWDAKSVKTGLYYMGFGEASSTDFTLADYSSIPLGALTPKKEVNRLIDLAIVNKATNYTASSYASWAKTLETDYVIDTEASPTTGAVTLAISLTGAKEGKKVTWFVNPSSFTMSVTAGTLKRLGTGEVVLNRINIIELYYAGGYVYYFVTSPTTIPFQYRPFLFDLTDEMFPSSSRAYANVLTGTGSFTGVNPQAAYANRQGVTSYMAGTTILSGVHLRIGRGASSGSIGNFFLGAGFVVFAQDRFLIPVISSGSQRIIVKAGWTDYDTDFIPSTSNGILFNYTDNANSGKFSLNIHKNTATPAVIDTNITPTAGKWYRTLIIVNKDGTKIKAYLFDDDTYDNNTALFETTIDSSGYLSIWNGTPQSLVTTTKSTDCPVGSSYPHGRGVGVYRTVGNVNQALLVVDQMSSYALAEATI